MFALPTQVMAPLRDLTPVELRQVRRSPEEKLFNNPIRQYHYLGYLQPVGEHLKYMAYAKDRVIACFAFSSASYAIDHRDTFIGWSAEVRECNRHLNPTIQDFLFCHGEGAASCAPFAW